MQGVVVSAVDPASPAADKNFRPGDVIVEVAEPAGEDAGRCRPGVDADVKAGKKAELMLVNRGGDLTYVGFKLN